MAFGAATVLQAAPIAARRYFPSEDGPSHIASGEIIARHTGVLQQYFENDFLTPNSSGHLLTAALMWATTPVGASRILFGLMAITLPLSARYAFTALGPSGRLLAWFSLPIAIGWPLHHGVFNYNLGTSILLVALGWWWRHEDGGRRAALVLALLLAALLATHIIPFFVGLLLLGGRATWRSFTDAHARRPMLHLALAAAVPTLLAVAYSLSQVSDGAQRQDMRSLGANLLTFRQVIPAYREAEQVPALLLAVAFGGLGLFALVRVAPRRWRDASTGLLVAGLVLLLGYFLLPDNTESGGGALTARLFLMFLLAALAWMAQLELPRRAVAAGALAAIVVSLALTAIRIPLYGDFEAEVAEVAAIGQHIPQGSTVVPVNLAQDNDPATTLVHSVRVRPTIQAVSWLMAEHRVADLSHFEAFFAVGPPRFRPDVDPFGPIGGGRSWLDASPPEIDLLGYEDATDGRGQVDFVVVFGRAAASPEVLADPLTDALDAQLAEGYELVATSSPQGLAELYRRRP